MSIHDKVRQEMLNIYRKGDYRIEIGNQKVDFVDGIGRQLFKEGADFFKEANIDNQPIIQSGKYCYIFSWMGDRVVNTLTVLLIRSGFVSSCFGGVIEVQNSNADANTFWAGCGAIRRSVFKDVGGFDEKKYKKPSIEDIDLGYRLSQKGYKIFLDKDIQVKHLKSWNFMIGGRSYALDIETLTFDEITKLKTKK